MNRFTRFLIVFVIVSAIGLYITEGVLEPSLFLGFIAGIISLFFKTKTKVAEKKTFVGTPVKQETKKGRTRFERYMLVSGIVAAIFAVFALQGDMPASEGLGLSVFLGLMVGLISIPFDTEEESRAKKALAVERRREAEEKERARKREAEEKERARKREAEERERARKAPGCYSMNNVDILSFSSSNNIFTAGNNSIKLRIRNRNSYAIIVSIRFRYSESGDWDSSTKSYEVGGNQIRTIDTLGNAWSKAKDVTIVAVY